MKKIIGLILSGLLSFVIWATISAAIENIKIDLEIKEFVEKAIYVPEVSTEKNKYYKVIPDHDLDMPTYTVSGTTILPGGPGDILTTRLAAIDIPVINEGITFYVGGHAGLCAFPYQDQEKSLTVNNTIEVTGFGDDITVGRGFKKSWFIDDYYEIMAYRVDTSVENRFKAFNQALSYFGESYNYSFIFNTENKKYCSDLVSQSYNYAGINLNPDYVATTVLDLMASKNTYLTYYSRVDQNKVRHTYILTSDLTI